MLTLLLLCFLIIAFPELTPELTTAMITEPEAVTTQETETTAAPTPAPPGEYQRHLLPLVSISVSSSTW